MPSILLVDDDPRLREVVRYALAREGFAVEEAENGSSALTAVPAKFDLVVLDVMMPEMDGLEVCRKIRKESTVPILFLSSKADEIDRVIGLELGGDDYLAKPFSPRELVSRVKAILRRSAGVAETPKQVTEVGGVRMDVEAHRVWAGGTEIVLTATEFRLLKGLVQRPDRVFSRDELVALGYEGVHFVADRTLDSHIRGIRAKLRPAGLDPIETVHGVGYRFKRG